jgi:hypothetical protein
VLFVLVVLVVGVRARFGAGAFVVVVAFVCVVRRKQTKIFRFSKEEGRWMSDEIYVAFSQLYIWRHSNINST